jgi:hypothetical protein
MWAGMSCRVRLSGSSSEAAACFFAMSLVNRQWKRPREFRASGLARIGPMRACAAAVSRPYVSDSLPTVGQRVTPARLLGTFGKHGAQQGSSKAAGRDRARMPDSGRCDKDVCRSL